MASFSYTWPRSAPRSRDGSVTSSCCARRERIQSALATPRTGTRSDTWKSSSSSWSSRRRRSSDLPVPASPTRSVRPRRCASACRRRFCAATCGVLSSKTGGTVSFEKGSRERPKCPRYSTSSLLDEGDLLAPRSLRSGRRGRLVLDGQTLRRRLPLLRVLLARVAVRRVRHHVLERLVGRLRPSGRLARSGFVLLREEILEALVGLARARGRLDSRALEGGDPRREPRKLGIERARAPIRLECELALAERFVGATEIEAQRRLLRRGHVGRGEGAAEVRDRVLPAPELEGADPQHVERVEMPGGCLDGRAELLERVFEEAHLAVRDPRVVAGLAVGLAQLLLHASLEVAKEREEAVLVRGHATRACVPRLQVGAERGREVERVGPRPIAELGKRLPLQ